MLFVTARLSHIWSFKNFRRCCNLAKASFIPEALNSHPQVRMVLTDEERVHFVVPTSTPVCKIDCEKAFEGLSETERKYAHYMSEASWLGSLIVPLQVSVESPMIFVFLQRLFAKPVNELRSLAIEKCSFTDEEFKNLLVYAAGFFENMSNYKSFGDTKFVPDVVPAKLKDLVVAAGVANGEKLMEKIGDRFFSLEKKQQRLGMPETGTTTYISSNITKADSDLVNEYMKSKLIEGWNTRTLKNVKDGKTTYEIRLASISSGVSGPEQFKGAEFLVTKGDYSQLLKRTVEKLQLAKKYVANENQEKMITEYINHFTSGSLDDHKNASRHWIRDIGPAVESYIGFIENYRDPFGVRSEFESFVACVNREMTKKFSALVLRAEELIKRMPWGVEYEKDAFLAPDFTSLDVITFAGSGVPAGINIPNYDEIRQYEGFKNVSLGNVISATPKRRIPFLTETDEHLYHKYHVPAFEVQVGLHELLGHGCGKLFERRADGTFSFDQEKVKHLLTGEKISSWYEPGETYSSKFGGFSSAAEECRAEAVGYYLSTFDDVLQIFGHEGDEASDVMYVNWLSEMLSGLKSLQYYSPEHNKWGQAHCHARYTLMRVVQAAGQGFLTIEEKTGDDGKPDLLFTVDSEKIVSVGRPAIFDFLKKIQAYKSTADVDGMKALFDKVAPVDELFLHYRQIVIDRKLPRPIMLQANTVLEGNDVKLVEYEESFEGVIKSMSDRFQDQSIFDDLLTLAEKDFESFA